MQIINFLDCAKDLASILPNLWNQEYGFIFPITDELFQRNTYGTKGFLPENSYVALVDNQPIGFIITKTWDDDYKIPAYESVGWISLIFVQQAFRSQGIGTRLLDLSINYFKNQGIKHIYLGKDYQNFFPGLPKDLKAFGDWFSKRGFEALYETNDLINLNLSIFSKELLPYHDHHEYLIRLAKKEDLPQLLDFMTREFPGRWFVELKDYLNNGGKGDEYLICLNSSQEVVGFCRIGTYQTPINLIGFSLTWRARFARLGGLGPLGVAKDHRHNNIAHNLLVTGVMELRNRGCNQAIIDWTNLLELYRKYGFEIWKTYIYTEIKL